MIKAAVIGVGSMGKNHARVYRELSGASLVAASDTNKSALAEVSSRFGCKAYTDYTEMLRKEEIDAVSIAVPTRMHSDIALDCIEAGKHVLVEKPIADSEASARKMINAAAKAGVVLTVGHIERFNPAVSKLKKLMTEGKFGDVTSIMARRVGVFPPRIKDANVFLDLAVHDIDIFNHLLGERPREVYAKSGHALNSGREDHAIIALTYGETTCVVQVNWLTPVKIRELAVTGTKGYGELNYITQELKVFESNYETTYDSFGDFVVKFGSPREVVVEVEKTEPLKAELSHFIQCSMGRKEPAVTGEDALATLAISKKAIESYRKDRVLEIKYDS